MNQVISLILWAFLDLLDQWVPREHKEALDQEDLKAGRDSRDLQVLTESPVFQETPARPDLQANMAPQEWASCLRWRQGSTRRPLLTPWRPLPEVNQDHEDPLGIPAQLVHPEVRASQERPESRVQWGNQATGDQTDLQGNQDLTEKQELQVRQESLASLDLWELEGSQVCLDCLDSRVIRAMRGCSAQRERLELWASRERLVLRVRWDPQALRVQWECRASEAELGPADQWVNGVLLVTWANLVLWGP